MEGKILLTFELFLDGVGNFKSIQLLNSLLWVTSEERVDGAERYPSIDGKFLEWNALLVQEVLVGSVNELNVLLISQCSQDRQIFFHFCNIFFY